MTSKEQQCFSMLRGIPADGHLSMFLLPTCHLSSGKGQYICIADQCTLSDNPTLKHLFCINLLSASSCCARSSSRRSHPPVDISKLGPSVPFTVLWFLAILVMAGHKHPCHRYTGDGLLSITLQQNIFVHQKALELSVLYDT